MKLPADRILKKLFSSSAVITAEVIALCILSVSLFLHSVYKGPVWPPSISGITSAASEDSYIKWVDFDVTSEAMNHAFRYDVATCQSDIHLNWIELLACLGARYGGDFSNYRQSDLDAIAEKLQSGEATMAELTQNLSYYPYYLEAYSAVLTGMVGNFEAEIPYLLELIGKSVS